MASATLPPDEWHAKRRGVIGASEIAAICGESRYSGPHKIWLLKTGRIPPDDDTRDTTWGHLMEPVARELYERRMGVKASSPGHRVHPDYSFVGATPDGLVYDATGKPVKTVQFKASNRWAGWGADETHDFPAYHYFQVTWEMGVMGVDMCDLVVLIDGERDIRVYPNIPFDAALFDAMLERARHFWETYVLPDVEPPVDGSLESEARLAERWPEHTGDTLTVDDSPETTAAVERLRLATDAKKLAEGEYTAAKNAVAEIIRDTPGLQGAYGRVSYKSQTRNSLDVPSLCASFNISDEQLAAHTGAGKPFRVLRLYTK